MWPFHKHDYVPVDTIFRGFGENISTRVVSQCSCSKYYYYIIKDAHLSVKDITT